MNQPIFFLSPATSLRFTSVSRVKLLPFFSRREGEEFIVGCPLASIYMSIPEIGVEALKLLDQGRSISEVAYLLRDSDGEMPDMLDFVETLLNCGLITEIDGRAIGAVEERANLAVAESDGQMSRQEERTASPVVFERFSWLQPSRVHWLYGRVALIVHSLVFLAVVFTLWQNPVYIPKSNHFFFHQWYTVNALVILATTWLFIVLHEFGHLAAARAYGVDGRITIGRRLNALVAQCELAHLYQIPRSQRVVVYLGGVIVNLWIFFIALILLVWQGPMLPSLLNTWLHLALIVQWYSTIWQLRFYLQTDIYFIVSELLHARTLHEDTQHYLQSLLRRLFGRTDTYDLTLIPKRERHIIRLYAVFYLIGMGIALTAFMVYLLPFIFGMLVGAFGVLVQGSAVGISRFIDALVTLTIYVVYFSLLGRILWRDRMKNTLRSMSVGTGSLKG